MTPMAIANPLYVLNIRMFAILGVCLSMSLFLAATMHATKPLKKKDATSLTDIHWWNYVAPLPHSVWTDSRYLSQMRVTSREIL
jgi:hypothetical protein